MDIGANCGQSTAHFLADERRFCVLAVEPNPSLASQLRRRFASEIDDGRLVVVELAIWHEGNSKPCQQIPLYINSSDCEWSSVYRGCGERYGTDARAVSVSTTTMARLYSEIPSPAVCAYIKIDIEGADGICLQQLRDNCKSELLPAFLSFELNCWPDLHLASSLGYTRFKLVPQSKHSVAPPTGDDAVPVSGGALWSSGPWGDDSIDVHGRCGPTSWVDYATLECDIAARCVSHVAVPKQMVEPGGGCFQLSEKTAENSALTATHQDVASVGQYGATQERFLAARPVWVQHDWSCLRSPFPLESKNSEEWFDVHCTGMQTRSQPSPPARSVAVDGAAADIEKNLGNVQQDGTEFLQDGCHELMKKAHQDGGVDSGECGDDGNSNSDGDCGGYGNHNEVDDEEDVRRRKPISNMLSKKRRVMCRPLC